MSGRESDGTSRESTQELLARAQELVDAKPADGVHPLEWAVPAHFLGDMSALAAVSLRAGVS